MTELTSCITFNSPPTEEVLRLDKEGFHYRGQFIADAGEAHRLMVEFLRQQTQPKPQGLSKAELRQLFDDQSGYINDEQVMWWADFHKATRAVLARWGRPAIEPQGPTEEEIEAAARVIYGSMRFDRIGYTEPWVERGNSFTQDEARRCARAVLARWGS